MVLASSKLAPSAPFLNFTESSFSLPAQFFYILQKPQIHAQAALCNRTVYHIGSSSH